MKPVRFLPLVALAAFALLALKLTGLMLGEGYMLTGTQKSIAKTTPEDDKKAGKKSKSKDQEKLDQRSSLAAKRIGAKKPEAPRDIGSLLGENHRTASEIKLLTSLSKRREQLDSRERQLGLRDNLIKAAEIRVNERIALLKKLESRVQRYAKAQKEEKKAQYSRLVKMYSAMKPKGAARIFNELDKKILLGIIQNMKPAVMSTILAAMEPAKAREMTISLAGNTQQKFTENNLDELPKINGN